MPIFGRIIGCLLLMQGVASAQSQATMVIGYPPGAIYDVYGRLVARHLGKHLPGNPTVVVQNMPGAGSLRSANYLYSVAPKVLASDDASFITGQVINCSGGQS